MKLVVDTNILVSFFRENPVNKIISNKQSFNLQLFSPDYVIGELENNRKDILKYSGLNIQDFNSKLDELKQHINIIKKEDFTEFRKKAKTLIHDKDIPIFALALKLNCPIWSNEPLFKKQSDLIVFSTRDIIDILF